MNHPVNVHSLSEDTSRFLVRQRQTLTAANEAFVINLISFVHWPDLVEFPPESVSVAARICALIERRPTAAILLPRLLGEPQHRIQEIIATLVDLGCLRLSGGLRETGNAPDESATQSLTLVLLEKIFQRFRR